MIDLFGNEISEKDTTLVNIYADEIQNCIHSETGQEWMYMGATFEEARRPLLDDLIAVRYCTHRDNWRDYEAANSADIHWTEIKGDANKFHIASRWLDYLYNDCLPGNRKFRFSILGINMSNLNLDEFADEQRFNSVYNRFFRTMVMRSLQTYFGPGVVIGNIYHEEGQQEHHEYFNWHTHYRLAKDLGIPSKSSSVIFLPKSQRADVRSNNIQLIDMLMGMYKDLHLGVNHGTYSARKNDLLQHKFIQKVLEERVLKVGYNPNSRFGYHNRFSVSLFPNRSSQPQDIERNLDNFYDLKTEPLAYYAQYRTSSLF